MKMIYTVSMYNLNSGLSLSFVDEECYLLELEVKEPIFLMHGVAPKIVTQNHMPVSPEVLV